MILNGEKRLLTLKELKPVDVGNYPEISVKKLYAEFAERETMKPYLPPKIPKSRQMDKEYFFNVVNTLFEDELKSILEYANA